jgi:hypothetical protein
MEFARRQLNGESETDQFGFDPEFNSRMLFPVARVLHQRWFRLQMRGLPPGAGPALVVANHSGTLPVDAVMLQAGLDDEHPANRTLRLLPTWSTRSPAGIACPQEWPYPGMPGGCGQAAARQGGLPSHVDVTGVLRAAHLEVGLQATLARSLGRNALRTAMPRSSTAASLRYGPSSVASLCW